MKKLNAILSRVFKIDEDSITDKTSPDDVETWDSFNGLLLISELEKEFNIKFTMDEVTSIRNVGGIKQYLKKHRVELDE